MLSKYRRTVTALPGICPTDTRSSCSPTENQAGSLHETFLERLPFLDGFAIATQGLKPRLYTVRLHVPVRLVCMHIFKNCMGGQLT